MKNLTTGQKARNKLLGDLVYNLYSLIGWLKRLQIKKQ